MYNVPCAGKWDSTSAATVVKRRITVAGHTKRNIGSFIIKIIARRDVHVAMWAEPPRCALAANARTTAARNAKDTIGSSSTGIIVD